MKERCRAYVLVTCLYLLALLSISGLTALHSASLMAQHARLLDATRRGFQEARTSLQVAEARLLRGEPPGADSSAADDCGSSTDSRLRVVRLHERRLSVEDEEGQAVTASWVVYGLRACRDGRAVLETTLGVIEPYGAIDESALPPGLEQGRLSWRPLW